MKDNSRKISSEEIAELYTFTRKHYVEYYDVQTELVDHLATAMEERWQKAPEMTFEENLNLEFKKFGIFGFSEIVEKRQAALEKKYLKLIWEEFKLLLKRPEILLPTIFLFIICKFLLQTQAGYSILFWGFVLFCLFPLFFLIKFEVLYKKKKKSSKKIFLLEELIYKAGNFSTFLIFPIYILNSLAFEDFAHNTFLQLLIAVLVPAFVILNYISLYMLPKKKNIILKKNNSEIELSE